MLTGQIYIPVCSVIYKAKVLKRIFSENQLLGDYYEDYAIALLAIKDNSYKCLPIPFAGISYHGENTVLEQDRTHWDYSYTTFLSEIVNKNLVNKHTYSLFNNFKSSSYAEFESFTKGLIWKYLLKYRGIRKSIRSLRRKMLKK